jgi:hypothetical protein
MNLVNRYNKYGKGSYAFIESMKKKSKDIPGLKDLFDKITSPRQNGLMRPQFTESYEEFYREFGSPRQFPAEYDIRPSVEHIYSPVYVGDPPSEYETHYLGDWNQMTTIALNNELNNNNKNKNKYPDWVRQSI